MDCLAAAPVLAFPGARAALLAAAFPLGLNIITVGAGLSSRKIIVLSCRALHCLQRHLHQRPALIAHDFPCRGGSIELFSYSAHYVIARRTRLVRRSNQL